MAARQQSRAGILPEMPRSCVPFWPWPARRRRLPAARNVIRGRSIAVCLQSPKSQCRTKQRAETGAPTDILENSDPRQTVAVYRPRAFVRRTVLICDSGRSSGRCRRPAESDDRHAPAGAPAGRAITAKAGGATACDHPANVSDAASLHNARVYGRSRPAGVGRRLGACKKLPLDKGIAGRISGAGAEARPAAPTLAVAKCAKSTN